MGSLMKIKFKEQRIHRGKVGLKTKEDNLSCIYLNAKMFYFVCPTVT